MMKERNVLVTSAGVATAINVIGALRKSKKFDCHIVATDMDEDAVGLYLADQHYITPSATDDAFIYVMLDIVKKENIDFIFPLHSSEVELFSSEQGLFQKLGVGITIANLHAINMCVNKDKFLSFLDSKGFSYPRTYDDPENIDSWPVFMKPIVGSSSKNTYKISGKQELLFNFEGLIQNYIIQEYIDWKEVTIDCFVNRNGVLTACVPRYRVKVRDGKSVVASTFYDERLLVLAERLLRELEYKGACNIQVFISSEDVKVIEVNPRLAAGGLPLSVAAGVNIPEMMILDSDNILSNSLYEYKRNLTMYRYLAEVFVEY